jgi:hypothetical protein
MGTPSCSRAETNRCYNKPIPNLNSHDQFAVVNTLISSSKFYSKFGKNFRQRNLHVATVIWTHVDSSKTG